MGEAELGAPLGLSLADDLNAKTSLLPAACRGPLARRRCRLPHRRLRRLPPDPQLHRLHSPLLFWQYTPRIFVYQVSTLWPAHALTPDYYHPNPDHARAPYRAVSLDRLDRLLLPCPTHHV